MHSNSLQLQFGNRIYVEDHRRVNFKTHVKNIFYLLNLTGIMYIVYSIQHMYVIANVRALFQILRVCTFTSVFSSIEGIPKQP